MLIAVPTGDCRAACQAALKDFEAKRQEDGELIIDRSFKAIYDGAVHNGLSPTLDDIQKMKDMAARDCEHMMESHPFNESIRLVRLYLKMLDAQVDKDVVLDAQSFELIGGYLGR